MRYAALLIGMVAVACTRPEPRADSATVAETLMAAPDSASAAVSAPPATPATRAAPKSSASVGATAASTTAMPRTGIPGVGGNLLYDSTATGNTTGARAREPRMSKPPQTP